MPSLAWSPTTFHPHSTPYSSMKTLSWKHHSTAPSPAWTHGQIGFLQAVSPASFASFASELESAIAKSVRDLGVWESYPIMSLDANAAFYLCGNRVELT